MSLLRRACIGRPWMCLGRGPQLSRRYLSTDGSASARANREAELLQLLREVREPITGRSVVSLGLLQSAQVDAQNNATLQLDLLVPG